MKWRFTKSEQKWFIKVSPHVYNHRISNSDNVVGVNDIWQFFANVREESRQVWHWGKNYQRSSVKPKLASETNITLLNQERKGWNSGQQLRQTLMWYVEEQKCVWRLLRLYLHCLEVSEKKEEAKYLLSSFLLLLHVLLFTYGLWGNVFYSFLVWEVLILF